MATDDSTQSLDIPDDCVNVADRTGPAAQESTVSAMIEQDDTNPDIVTITYDSITNDDPNLGVDIPSRLEVVDSAGFDDHYIGGSDFYWNTSSDSHWISYRMSSFQSTESHDDASPGHHTIDYPHSENSIIIEIPDHAIENVTIQPTDEGHIGSDLAYLGDHTVESRDVGCQTFEVVVDDDVSRWFDANDRLDDLEVAAKAINGGQQFETVSIFVTPHDLGDVGGFNRGFGNSIVIEDYNSNRNPSFLWIHEYVHSLQQDTIDSNLYWTVEASANYLSYKIALDHGLATSVEYDAQLAPGYMAYENVTLDRSIHHQAAYHHGAAVFAQLDSDLENSETSIYDVFDWIYTDRSTDYDDLQAYLAAEANLSEGTLEQYDERVFDSQPADEQYQNSWMGELPPRVALEIGALFAPGFRMMSIVFLPLSVCLLGNTVIRVLRLRPEFDF
ncbi:hypothetical protein [Natronorubrum sp. DTA7]|uniref:hypothetical protein n=1 Tax=Natronorubrum sp. DTA7 TaxID=3447016 RepID=UPI003F857646